MTSLLTNESAMVALNTLRGINKNLTETQAQISTGKTVATARDNAAIWAVSTVMQSDVNGFKAISESLGLGSSSVAVARTASENVTDLLTEIKGLVVAAQEDNVDRGKIQTDIGELRNQINSIVDAAQFNGLNLLKGFEGVDVLSSLDRAADQTVSASKINISRYDLTTAAGSYNAVGTVFTTTGITETDVGSAGIDNAARELDITVAGQAIGDEFSISIGNETFSYTAVDADEDVSKADLISQINGAGIEGITATDGGTGIVTIENTSPFESYDIGVQATGTGTITAAGGATSIDQRADYVDIEARQVVNGDGYRIQIGAQRFDYIAKEGDDINDVVKGLKAAIDEKAPTVAETAGITAKVVPSLDPNSSAARLFIDNNTASNLAITVEARQDGEATGGLRALSSIDVSSADGATRALDNIEGLIQTSIDAAASFGSTQKRIDIQDEFITNLMDALKTGIGALTDTDMEEASARLQSLQVQQQLGVQALSIANQGPQALLSLFR